MLSCNFLAFHVPPSSPRPCYTFLPPTIRFFARENCLTLLFAAESQERQGRVARCTKRATSTWTNKLNRENLVAMSLAIRHTSAERSRGCPYAISQPLAGTRSQIVIWVSPRQSNSLKWNKRNENRSFPAPYSVHPRTPSTSDEYRQNECKNKYETGVVVQTE